MGGGSSLGNQRSPERLQWLPHCRIASLRSSVPIDRSSTSRITPLTPNHPRPKPHLAKSERCATMPSNVSPKKDFQATIVTNQKSGDDAPTCPCTMELDGKRSL